MTDAATATVWSPRQKAARISLLSVLYLAFGHFSFLPLVQNVLVTPAVFYSEGIALAFVLRYGAWVWPGIFLGQLALALTRGLPLLPALGISASNSAQACLGGWLFRRFGLEPRLERARDLTGLLVLIFFVLQPLGATLSHASLWLGGVIDTPLGLALSWRDWWLGCVLGQMLVTPLLLSVFAGHRSRRDAIGDAFFAMAVLTPAMVAGEYIWLMTGMTSVIALLAPVFVWLAIRRGLVAVCMGGLFVAAVAMVATGRGWGPFGVGGAASIINFDVYLASMTVGKQLLAVFLRQLARQRETEERLRAEEQRLKAAAVVREQALEADRRRELEAKLKTSLAAAAVAHEIAQPLSTILLQSNLAADEDVDTREAMATVAAEARQVVGTIDRMKALLRNVQTDHRLVDLDRVVRVALLYNTGMLERHGITVRERCGSERCTILGDEEQLRVAINNVVRNAPRREISVDLESRGTEVILTIGDSGPGWSGAERAETPLTTTKRGGTGVGLFVVRTAVENHGGRLEFGRSALGGAEVRMTFPRALAPAGRDVSTCFQ
jgi:signal transduction histidine kinase